MECWVSFFGWFFAAMKKEPMVALQIVAISAAIYQLWMFRISHLVSVRPLLTGRTGSSQCLKMSFINSGAGPAIIQDFRIFYKGELVQGTPYDIWEQLFSKDPELHQSRISGTNQQLPAGSIISDKETFTFIEIQYKGLVDAEVQKIKTFFQHVKVECRYKSMRGEQGIYCFGINSEVSFHHPSGEIYPPPAPTAKPNYPLALAMAALALTFTCSLLQGLCFGCQG